MTHPGVYTPPRRDPGRAPFIDPKRHAPLVDPKPRDEYKDPKKPTHVPPDTKQPDPDRS
jgi:hypothetical protein